jgi:hypothetical protein
VSDDEIAEAKALVETVRAGPPSYDPERVRTLRLADLLTRALAALGHPPEHVTFKSVEGTSHSDRTVLNLSRPRRSRP